MKIYINGLEYDLKNDYNIEERAGSTAVMTASIKLDDKRVPQPFDSVIINEEEKNAGGDILEGSNYKDNVQIKSGVLSLKKEMIYVYSSLFGKNWGDLF